MSYGRETLTDIWEKISERDTNKNIEIKEIVGKNNDGYYDVLKILARNPIHRFSVDWLNCVQS